MTTVTIKQGESFILDGQYTEDDGTTPKSLVGITLSSQIRDSSQNLIEQLTLSIINAGLGTFRIESPTSTLDWKVGKLYWDLMQIENGITSISATSEIIVERAITHG